MQTHTERLYLWEWAAACDEGAEGAPDPGLGRAGGACVCNAIGGVLQAMREELLSALQSGWVSACAQFVQTRMVHKLRLTSRM